MLGVMVLIIPVAALMAAANLAGVVQVWMAYPYMLVIGVTMVVEMTSRRSLVYDLVGLGQITTALALEALAMTAGTLVTQPHTSARQERASKATTPSTASAGAAQR